MRKEAKTFHTLIFLGLLIFLGGACSTETGDLNAVKAANAEQATESADAEINSALKVIEKAPESPNGYNNLAAVYIRKARETGDFGLNAKAETAVDKALQAAPENADAKKLKATLHLTFHRFRDALELGAKLQKENPNEAFVYGVLTDASAELGNYEQAIEAAQKMVDLRPNMSSYARVAHLRSLHGDTDGAIEMFKLAARTASPSDKESQSWCLVQIGDELWKNGRYAEAEKVYDEALLNFSNYHYALAGKGRARAAQNDSDAAIKFLTEAQNRVPNAETIILLGDVYARQGNAEKANRQYDLAEIVEGKLGAAGDRKTLAIFWADRGVKLDEALAITKSEYETRKDIYTADALAWSLYKKGFLSEARAAIADAMRLKTKDAKIFYHAGMIEKDSGNRNEAKRLLESALKLNPSFDLPQAEKARIALLELS